MEIAAVAELTVAEDDDVHPTLFVTVTVYAPAPTETVLVVAPVLHR